MSLIGRTTTQAAYLKGYRLGTSDIMRSIQQMLADYASRVEHQQQQLTNRLAVNDYLQAYVHAEAKERFEYVVESLRSMLVKHEDALRTIEPLLSRELSAEKQP